MRTPSSLLAAIAVSIAVLAHGEAHAVVTGPAWTFTRTSGAWAPQIITTAPGVDAMVFSLSTSGIGATRLARMGFMVTGSLQPAEVANFQLVYYPDGPASPGVVVGSNSGSAWALGRTTSIVNIDLDAAFTLQGSFTGFFGLRADVNGVRTFFFQPQLQTVTIETNGIQRFLMDTEDLPLAGDSFYVN